MKTQEETLNLTRRRPRRYTSNYALIRANKAFNQYVIIQNKNPKTSGLFAFNELAKLMGFPNFLAYQEFEKMCKIVIRDNETDLNKVLQIADKEGNPVKFLVDIAQINAELGINVVA